MQEKYTFNSSTLCLEDAMREFKVSSISYDAKQNWAQNKQVSSKIKELFSSTKIL
jgi:hypothetical protein